MKTIDINQMLVDAKQDTNWLTEKAHGSLFVPATLLRRRAEIEERRRRILLFLEVAPQVMAMQQDALNRGKTELEALQREVYEAICGLRDFLQVILLLEMPDETRAIVQTQFNTVNDSLTAYDANQQQA